MDSISISQLKTHPAKAIMQASDFPLAVQKRNQVAAYLIGSDLYEKIVDFLENQLDRIAIKNTDFKKGRDFEKLTEELGI